MFEIERTHFETIDSTNNWAKEHASSFKPGILYVISADHQTAGRGRFDRSWVSPPSENIYVTYVYVFEKLVMELGHLPQVLAMAARKVLAKHVDARLKWPNDVLVGGRKIGGILAESVALPTGLVLVTGIGINVNMPLKTASTIDRPATSLLIETNEEHDIHGCLNRLTATFSEMLCEFLDKGFRPFIDEYRVWVKPENAAPLTFDDGQRKWTGQFSGINDDGSLSLDVDGEKKSFYAGEILF